jgi:hypothetical protein
LLKNDVHIKEKNADNFVYAFKKEQKNDVEYKNQTYMFSEDK